MPVLVAGPGHAEMDEIQALASVTGRGGWGGGGAHRGVEGPASHWTLSFRQHPELCLAAAFETVLKMKW